MKEIKDLGFGVIQVNETKSTISKTESVDNYLCKWQKLKEWLEEDIEKNHKENEQTDLSVFLHYIAVEQCILQKMRELEGEDENHNN